MGKNLSIDDLGCSTKFHASVSFLSLFYSVELIAGYAILPAVGSVPVGGSGSRFLGAPVRSRPACELHGTAESLKNNHVLLAGNFCPLCDKCYDDDDYESKMMQCGKCDRWVHSKCENLSGKTNPDLLRSSEYGAASRPKESCVGPFC